MLPAKQTTVLPPTQTSLPRNTKYHTQLLMLMELIRKPTRITTEAAAPTERDTAREPPELPELLRARVSRDAPSASLIAEVALEGSI